MDFTSAYLTPKTGHKQETVTVQDCIIVLEYFTLDKEGNRVRNRQNLDFLCDCPDTNKHDYFFVLQVWRSLFEIKQLNQHFDTIDIFTDGGPHHFRTRFCQWMWLWLSCNSFDNKRITHHFFCIIPRSLPRRRSCGNHQARTPQGL